MMVFPPPLLLLPPLLIFIQSSNNNKPLHFFSLSCSLSLLLFFSYNLIFINNYYRIDFLCHFRRLIRTVFLICLWINCIHIWNQLGVCVCVWIVYFFLIILCVCVFAHLIKNDEFACSIVSYSYDSFPPISLSACYSFSLLLLLLLLSIDHTNRIFNLATNHKF